MALNPGHRKYGQQPSGGQCRLNHRVLPLAHLFASSGVCRCQASPAEQYDIA
jgi:hypothetical protein